MKDIQIQTEIKKHIVLTPHPTRTGTIKEYVSEVKVTTITIIEEPYINLRQAGRS